jgi:hypothetical protein
MIPYNDDGDVQDYFLFGVCLECGTIRMVRESELKTPDVIYTKLNGVSYIHRITSQTTSKVNFDSIPEYVEK